MKKQLSILTFVAVLALFVGSCNMPLQEEFPPEEPWQEGPPPEDEFRPEEQPEEEFPPEEPGEAHIAFFEANPQTIRAGECAMLEWGVEGMADVTLNGEVVDQHGAREVCLSNTTSYHLEVHSGNGAQEREVRVVVDATGGAQPQPQPQPQPQQPPHRDQNLSPRSSR